jgi:outer membrane cobalamin receptor
MKKSVLFFVFTPLVFHSFFAWAAPAPPTSETISDEVVVTATRIGNLEYELTGDVTVISAAQIEASGARTVTEVLQQVPGPTSFKSRSKRSGGSRSCAEPAVCCTVTTQSAV